MNDLNINNLNDRLYCFNESELITCQVPFDGQSKIAGVFRSSIRGGVIEGGTEGMGEFRGAMVSVVMPVNVLRRVLYQTHLSCSLPRV